MPTPTAAGEIARLPVPLTPLVGREREAATVVELLRRPGVRFVTLIGPGGVGKTRLAIRVAEALQPAMQNGVCFTALAAITDPALVLPAVAQALGVPEEAERSLAETVRTALADRELLLVLDNLEHLPDAGAAIADLLAAGHRVRVLTTSRARLRLAGEHVFAVAPLALPEPEATASAADLVNAEAVRLFVDRAQAIDPTFVVTDENAADVGAICVALDGLPLAIELAAARVRVLPPRQLRARLGLALLTGGGVDRPERQRTVRATIAWSHDLLSPEEQTLFRHLAVFSGGFTLAMAEAVCGGTGFPVPSVLDLLESLVDQSLVQLLGEVAGEARFGMLETVREYALEQLRAHGELEAVRRRHAEAYVPVAQRAFVRFFRSDRGDWLDRLEADHDNLRAAIEFAVEAGDAELAQRIAGRVWPLWVMRGHLTEGVGWLERSLALGEETPPTALGDALFGLGQVCVYVGQHERAIGLGMRALELARATGSHLATGLALYLLGNAEFELGRVDRAQRRHEEALAIFLESGDKTKTGYIYGFLAWEAAAQGQYDRYEELAQQELALNREMKDPHGIANALTNLADAALLRGDLGRTAALAKEALAIRFAEREWTGVAPSLLILGRLAIVAGAPERAARWLAAAEELRSVHKLALGYEDRALHERNTEMVRAALGDEGFAAAWAAGRALSVAEVVAEALAYEPPPPAPDTGSLAAGPRLTAREREVLCLLAAGKTDRQIAAALFVEPSTAKRHVANLYDKLGLHNRAEATAYALRRGLCGEGGTSAS